MSELDGDSDNYTENFSDNDIYDYSSELDNSKAREKLFKSGSKNYKAYISDVEKQQILPRRMGFGKKEEKGNMFLKSFYIGDTYAESFSKGIKGNL